MEDAEEERHRRDQDALEAADIGKKVENSVSAPLDQNLVQVHSYHDSFN